VLYGGKKCQAGPQPSDTWLALCVFWSWGSWAYQGTEQHPWPHLHLLARSSPVETATIWPRVRRPESPPIENHCSRSKTVWKEAQIQSFIKCQGKPGAVAHTCNPSYSRGRDQEDRCSKPAWANSL
jgi:hypothetical protein